MSSIYDALKRVQEDGRAPEYSPPTPSSAKGARFWLIVLAAIILSSATTVVLHGLLSGGKEPTVQAKTADRPPTVAHTPAPRVPPNPDILFARAESMHRTGDTAGAAALYQEALRLAPGRSKEAYVRIGALFFQRRQYDQAVTTYQTALMYFKDDAVILNNLGGALLAKGDTDGAIRYFRLASNGSKDYVEPVYNLACAYARKGDKAAALDALNKALGMHPDVRRWAEKDPDLEILKGAEPMQEREKGE